MGTGVSVYFDGSILFAINNPSVDGHVVHAAPAGNSFVPVITSLIAGAEVLWRHQSLNFRVLPSMILEVVLPSVMSVVC